MKLNPIQSNNFKSKYLFLQNNEINSFQSLNEKINGSGGPSFI